MTRNRVAISFDPKEGRTQRSQASACDINLIVKRWLKTGEADHVNKADAIYGNFTNVDDYQAAREALARSQATFDALPSSLRSRFNNNAAELVEFFDQGVAEGAPNHAEAVELGLMPQPVVEAEPALTEAQTEPVVPNPEDSAPEPST